MSSGADVVILAEDERHRMLLHRHLRKRGYSHHRIRIAPWFPNFTTPCLSFVKAEYPHQVQSLRDKAHRVTSALFVVADADDATVAERLRDLDDLLPASGKARRGDDEHIAVVVARRNIETWMFFLAGNEVDEESDYKPQCRSFDNGEYARRFADFTWPRRELSANCPPSLRHACEAELTRLP
jgi:hypothetical protein